MNTLLFSSRCLAGRRATGYRAKRTVRATIALRRVNTNNNENEGVVDKKDKDKRRLRDRLQNEWEPEITRDEMPIPTKTPKITAADLVKWDDIDDVWRYLDSEESGPDRQEAEEDRKEKEYAREKDPIVKAEADEKARRLRRQYGPLTVALKRAYDKKENPDEIYEPLNENDSYDAIEGMEEEDEDEGDLHFPSPFGEHPFLGEVPNYYNRIIRMGRHVKLTPQGRLESFSAFVMIGTGEGAAGLGYGKAYEAAAAVEQAYIDAARLILPILRFRGNSIPREIKFTYRRVWVHMRPKRRGFGLRCKEPWRLVLEAFGLTDMSFSIGGAKNVINRYKAIFFALREHCTQAFDIARVTGKKIYFEHGNYTRAQ